MKWWKRTREAYKWTMDFMPRSWKRSVTRIERCKIKADTKLQILEVDHPNLKR